MQLNRHATSVGYQVRNNSKSNNTDNVTRTPPEFAALIELVRLLARQAAQEASCFADNKPNTATWPQSDEERS